jgi:PAS domain S-box-containing protein
MSKSRSRQPETDRAPAVVARREPRSLELDRRSSQGTEETLALYRSIFANSADAITIIDAHGRYLEQNPAHESLMGWSFEELRGATPAIHMGESAFAQVSATLAEHGSFRGSIRSRAKDGRLLDIELSAFAVLDVSGEPLCFVGVARDITERARAEAERERRFGQLDTLYRMSESLSRASRVSDVYAEALASLRRAFRTERASILLFDDDGVMRFKAWRGLSERYRAAVEGHSPWQRDADDPQPIVIADVRTDRDLAQFRALFEAEGIGALAFIPLSYNGQLLGKFMLYFDEPRYVEPDEIQLGQAIASHIAFAIARRGAEAENERLYREAEEANAAKSQFLATMSHELRTPLNAIAGYTELLELGLRGDITAAQREDLARIRLNQQHLLALINDVLSFAKIETGHLEIEPSNVHLEESLSTLRALIEPQLHAKRLVYTYRSGDPSITCWADREKLQQIALNLLSNAVKFTPAGGQVALDWEASDNDVRLIVRDTGPGIPAGKMETIFEPFVQLHHGLTRRAEGSGLGLAISRQLARAMGGDISVSSILGDGAIFTLRIPRRQP